MIAATESEYWRFRDLARRELGLDWTRDKKYLIETRLGQRLEQLGMDSFSAYHKHLCGNGGPAELQYFFNTITTTKTGFYRDSSDFDFFRQEVLADLRKQVGFAPHGAIRLWSAGCSSGEEPFTLAFETLEGMVPLSKQEPSLDLRILGSDINTDMLAIGEDALYLDQQMEGLPLPIRKKYFKPTRGNGRTAWQVASNVRSKVDYRHFNLFDRRYPIATKFQVIFFRNVLYYLDRSLRQPLLDRLVNCLAPGGWLFLGKVEAGYSMVGMKKIHTNIFHKTP